VDAEGGTGGGDNGGSRTPFVPYGRGQNESIVFGLTGAEEVS